MYYSRVSILRTSLIYEVIFLLFPLHGKKKVLRILNLQNWGFNLCPLNKIETSLYLIFIYTFVLLILFYSVVCYLVPITTIAKTYMDKKTITKLFQVYPRTHKTPKSPYWSQPTAVHPLLLSIIISIPNIS